MLPNCRHAGMVAICNQEEEDNMDVFLNYGKFEKRIGLSMHDEKEIYVVNKMIDEDEWINLDDFVYKNGGILNIPLFYHTDAPLFIIRHWAKIILKIIDIVIGLRVKDEVEREGLDLALHGEAVQ